MKIHALWLTVLAVALLPGAAQADPWKDESGHGRGAAGKGWGERFGEPPAWARGKGYWDGHFKHGPPPGRGGKHFPPPAGPHRGFYPGSPAPHARVWPGEPKSYKDQLKHRWKREKELLKWERDIWKQGRQRPHYHDYYFPHEPLPIPAPW